MKIFNKQFLFFSLIIVGCVFVITPIMVWADAPGTGDPVGGCPATGGSDGLPNPLGVCTFAEFLAKLMTALEPIIGILAVFFIILAGFQFLTAQGNEEKIKKAKQTFLWTIIGTAIALGADILIRVIVEILTTI